MLLRILFTLLLIVFGFVHLGFNLYGLMHPGQIRHPMTMNSDDQGRGVWNTDLVFQELETAKTIEDTEDYLRSVNRIFGKGVKHYWPKAEEYDPQIYPPLHSSLWPLHYFSKAAGEIGYQAARWLRFQDYQRVLYRGIGHCDQISIALSDYLNKQGYQANIVGLDGHVIVQVTMDDGQSYLLDPDLEIFFPFGLETAESPEKAALIQKAYEESGFSARFSAKTASFYEGEGNRIYARWGLNIHTLQRLILFSITFLAWVLPLGAIISGFWIFKNLRAKS